MPSSLQRYLPRPLLIIAATIVPVALACNYLSQLRDPHPAPATMTPSAVAARLAPFANVIPLMADAKDTGAAPAAASN